MKTDSQLRKDVIDELSFDPMVDETGIAVTAKAGIVSLTGTVSSYPQKFAAERAVKRVGGVQGIAEALKVELPSTHHRNDADIAQAAVSALETDTSVPHAAIVITVEHGWLTLTGNVSWNFQRDAAKRAVEHLIGVLGVTNLIFVEPVLMPVDVKSKIRQAFERNAGIDASRVSVELAGGTVTLIGTVRSWSEHDEATYAAASVPGVTAVKNLTHVV